MKQLPRYLRILAACLLAGFGANALMTVLTYDQMLTAVPLWMHLALDGLVFLLPAALAFAAAAAVQRRQKGR